MTAGFNQLRSAKRLPDKKLSQEKVVCPKPVTIALSIRKQNKQAFLKFIIIIIYENVSYVSKLSTSFLFPLPFESGLHFLTITLEEKK